MKKNMLGNLNSVALGAGGFIAAQQLNRVPFLQSNPLLGAGAKVAIGLLLSSGKAKMLQPVGMGMAVAGVTQLVGNVIGQAGVSGFLPAGSLDVASVSGGYPQIHIN